MIRGIGVDVVDVVAFGALLADPGTVFAARTFTEAERRVCADRPSGRPEVHLAARYAAKEACVKALSQAMAPGPLPPGLADLREIEVVCDAYGRPSLVLHGRVAELARGAGVAALHVSLSHDGGVAIAQVVAG